MKLFKFIKCGIFFLLGLSIFFLRGVYLEHLRFFIGGLVLVYCLDDLGMALLQRDEHERTHYLYKSIAQFIIGIILLVFVEHYETICVIWGIWAILRETEELKECYEMIKEKTPCVLNMVESVVAIVLSVLMIMEPGEHHANTHMTLLIVELFTAILFPEFRWIYKKFIAKKTVEE